MDYTCYCSVLLLIAHTRLLSDPEFYVSSYYSGCSHEQTRDKLSGDARVADSEASRRLPRMIYRYSPCVVEGHCLGISSVPPSFTFFCYRDSFKVVITMLDHKLYLDFPLLC